MNLEEILGSARQEIKDLKDLAELKELKTKYLGKKSIVMAQLKTLGSLPKEERPAFGKKVNLAKEELAGLLNAKEEELAEIAYNASLMQNKTDITMPGRKSFRGGLHPITYVWQEIEDIFMSMGFEIAESFDIEDEFHNFDALNTPQDHPARDLSDTFYIDSDTLLRTQTSTVQIRVMEAHQPPIRIISPGRCYRNDNDASHSPAFHQMEALVVDKGIDFADLKDILNIFVQKLFGAETKSRIRPHFFPFTEPSAEIDISCVKCLGKGCNVCKGSGWLELGGAGMVDPNVLTNLGINPAVYTGYAFGMGMDRVAMLKYKIPDMRMLFENDLRFLRQFK